MTICFLVNDLDTKAGWGRMASDLINAIKDQDNNAVVLSKEGGLLENPILNFFKIRKVFKNCDIIHALEVWPFGFLASVYAIGLGKKVIVSAIGTYSIAPLYNFFLKPVLSWTYKNAAKVTAISDYTAGEVNKIITDLNIKVIPNGIDFNAWSQKEGSFEEIYKFKPYILGVGSVKQRKGFHISISAFAEIAGSFPELKYIIAGQANDKNYVDRLKSIITMHNLTDRVILLGGVSEKNLVALYKNAELFILTPEEHNHHFEGFGLVYLEAAASGLPSIGSRQSGAETAIKDGTSGILVNQGDAHETALAIRKVLESAEFKKRLSDGALEWARQNTWQKAALKYIEIYKNAFNGK